MAEYFDHNFQGEVNVADRDVSMGTGGIYMSNPNASVLHFGSTPEPSKPPVKRKPVAKKRPNMEEES